MSLLQKNDQEIQCPITNNGEPHDTTTLSSAEYKLYTMSKDALLISKDLNSGITREGNVLTIKLTWSDTEELNGTYYHELTITDPVKGRLTVFKKTITFEATKN